jgi:hypothetical protein
MRSNTVNREHHNGQKAKVAPAPSLEESNKAIVDIINGVGAMAKPKPRKIDQPLLEAWPAG